MALPWLDVVAWSLVVAIAAFCVFPPQRYVSMRRTQFSQRTGAYVDPSFAATFDRDTRRLLRWAAVVLVLWTGAAEGMFAARLLRNNDTPEPQGACGTHASLFPGTRSGLRLAAGLLESFLSPFLMFSPFAAMVLAAVALGRLREAGREFRLPTSRSAVARPRRVGLSDYVSRPVQVAMWLAVAAVVVMAAIVLVSWSHGDTGTGVALVGACDVVVVVGMAAFTNWFGHTLCDRPTPAVDPSHLYLQDAWRAATLTWAYSVVGIAAYVAFLGLTGPADIGWLSSGLPLLFYPAALPLLLIGLTQQQRFRHRLWRTLPPGQVLLPGQPPPHGGGVPA